MTVASFYEELGVHQCKHTLGAGGLSAITSVWHTQYLSIQHSNHACHFFDLLEPPKTMDCSHIFLLLPRLTSKDHGSHAVGKAFAYFRLS